MTLFWLLAKAACGQAVQEPNPSGKSVTVDSVYIKAFERKNDLRTGYVSQRYLLEYGSRQNAATTGSGTFTNVSDLLGFGLTYKFLDFDFTFSLPKTRVLKTGLQNLEQFRLSGSYSGKKWTIRAYWLKSTGLAVADANGQFVSSPTVDLLNLGIQYTYYFNHTKYSFRSAAFQNEVQRRSAGSMLLRIEPFYRHLGVGTPVVPATLDVATTYGEQAGLQYAYAPGLIVQPGYGYNWVTHDGRWFVSPMVYLGAGFAVNIYKGNSGERTSVNMQWKGNASLSLGYNGPRVHATLRSSYEMDYFMLDPSYFLTSDLKLGITIGYRFNAVEKFLPESLF